MSYHDRILEAARKIEEDRKKTYTPNHDNLKWSERELHHLHIIAGKTSRLMYFIKDRNKAIDELLDIYNHTAMLYEEMNK